MSDPPPFTVHIRAGAVRPRLLDALAALFSEFPGRVPVVLILALNHGEDRELALTSRVAPTAELRAAVNRLLEKYGL